MMLLDVNPFRASRSAATVHWAANVVATAAAATGTVGTVRPVRGRSRGGDSGNKVELNWFVRNRKNLTWIINHSSPNNAHNSEERNRMHKITKNTTAVNITQTQPRRAYFCVNQGRDKREIYPATKGCGNNLR